ncbi:hypothetical protein [Methylocystis parvus]|uniref:Uncharacterized protein n=1 Tax=Methylocystis parvus TaxID=134 RepID=A0A6B8MG43_9HYPH|nr:hypothetical protein [Methylocystis parvus]QGN00134.1 hypothetical protein F7D14_21430 [Methylocystis parvus]WBK02558.1 hypothetical protein MMG94_21205 [Methylocystis parvus OBBP]
MFTLAALLSMVLVSIIVASHASLAFADEKRRANLQARRDEIEEIFQTGDEDEEYDADALSTEADTIEASLESLSEKYRTYDKAEKALAGAVVSVGSKGELVVSRGLVRQDQARYWQTSPRPARRRSPWRLRSGWTWPLLARSTRSQQTGSTVVARIRLRWTCRRAVRIWTRRRTLKTPPSSRGSAKAKAHGVRACPGSRPSYSIGVLTRSSTTCSLCLLSASLCRSTPFSFRTSPALMARRT